MIAALLLEIALVCAAGLAAWEGMAQALQGALAQRLEAGAVAPAPVLEALQAQLHGAQIHYALGVGALLLARLLTARRGLHGAEGRPIGAHLALPTLTAMTGLGAALQWGYASPWRGTALTSNGPAFCDGVLYGGLAGAAILLLIPERWDRALRVLRIAFTLAPVPLLIGLGLFGSGPGGSGPRINLLGFQPVELVKVCFAMALGFWFAGSLEKLQKQRQKVLGFAVPRVRLILPAALLLALLFAGLLMVQDLGPTLILSLLFLAVFAVCARAWLEILTLSGVAGGLLGLALFRGQGWLPARVLDRVQMWQDPWWNGMSNGDQLARGFWAMAAGGMRGQGPGAAMFGTVWAGDNDLILANLAEVFGFVGLAAYLALLYLLVAQGLWIARAGRDAPRMLLAFCLSLLLASQLLVIAGGTLGLLPLTGVVVPFLSLGKTSMVVLISLVALLVRLAGEGRARGFTQTRHALPASHWQFLLQRSISGTVLALLALWLGLLGQSYYRGVTDSLAASARGVLLVQRDLTVTLKFDPRVLTLARQIPPGEIRDRAGRILRGTAEDGSRTWPLGDSLGSLLGRALRGGPGEWEIAPERWSIESTFATRLRGYADRPERLGVWVERWTETDRSSGEQRPRSRVLRAALGLRDSPEARADAASLVRSGGALSLLTLSIPDFDALVPLIHLDRPSRAARLGALRADVDSRSVRLSLDARLQTLAAAALAEIVPTKGRAGAVVVLDVDTGEALARAQFPDLDLNHYEGHALWALRQAAGRPEKDQSPEERRFFGAYSPWRERTGRGYLQAGSIFKLVSSLAWARAGLPYTGSGCSALGSRSWSCNLVDGRPGFKKPGWREAIHDAHSKPDGQIEITHALEVSCNAFFAQLGLDLGVAPFEELVNAGLVLHGGTFLPQLKAAMAQAGDFGLAQTAFGQGAAAMSPLEAARMVAAVGAGGTYRLCPSLELGAPCEARRLVEQPDAITPILAGMKRVVDSGTLRRARLDGVRIYGKTGTAEDVGRREEEPWGLKRGATAKSHSWVVLLAEPGATEEYCRPDTAGRLAVAAVVDRGGFGSDAALAVALATLSGAKELGYFDP